MLFQKFNEIFGATPAVETNKPDVKLAVAELLVHAMHIDDDVDAQEIAVRDHLLKDKFGLNDAELNELVAQANKEHEESLDFYSFTSQIKQAYDREKREHIVEMMVELLLADGKITSEEMNMGWRIAGLLGFDNREWVMLHKRTEDRLQA